jgi:hypothetical protein
MTPRADLSAVMPSFNQASTLPRALDAIFAQSVQPREVIVVDDCSTDATACILANYADRYSRLTVVRNQGNVGCNEAIRRGLARASGRYVFFPASDDYILPGFIENLMSLLERHPESGLCCSYFSTVDNATGEVRENPSGWCDAPRYFTPAEAVKTLGRASIPGHATIHKRSSFDKAGGYLADLEWHADWFSNYVVAFRDGMCHVPEMLALLTVAPATYSATGMRGDRRQAVHNAILDRLLSADYQDVLPSFQQSGVCCLLGADMFRVAAQRGDAWSNDILHLLNCFGAAQYEELRDDPSPAVRELAALFAGPFRAGDEYRQLQHIYYLTDTIRRMQRSMFWRARGMLAKFKRLLRRLAPRHLTRQNGVVRH